MSSTDQLYHRAIQFARAGKKEEARRLLQAVLQAEPEHKTAWMWYADTFDKPEDRLAALEQILEKQPDNLRVQRAALHLRAQVLGTSQTMPVRPASSAVEPLEAKGVVRRSQALPIILGVLLIVMLCAASILAGWLIQLQEDYQALQDEYAALNDAHLDLQAQYAALKQDFTTVVLQYLTLLDQYTRLQQAYDALQATYTALQGQFAALQNDFAALRQQHDELNAQYNVLAGEYEEITKAYKRSQREYTHLQEIAIVPPVIYTRQREVVFYFKKLDQSYEKWHIDFDALARALAWGEEARQEPDYVELALGSENFKVVYFVPYVDSRPFSEVIPRLYKDSPNDLAFISEVWNIVTQLSLYSSDINETPRYPLETLMAGGGDCEDNAILFASMILAAPVDWDVHLVYMDSDNPTAPTTSNHVVVYVNTGYEEHYIETTNPAYMEPYPWGVNGWEFETK